MPEIGGPREIPGGSRGEFASYSGGQGCGLFDEWFRLFVGLTLRVQDARCAKHKPNERCHLQIVPFATETAFDSQLLYFVDIVSHASQFHDGITTIDADSSLGNAGLARVGAAQGGLGHYRSDVEHLTRCSILPH